MDLGSRCENQRCLERTNFLLLTCHFCTHKFCELHTFPQKNKSEEGGHYCPTVPDEQAVACPVCGLVLSTRNTDPNVTINLHLASNCATKVAVFSNSCAYKNCAKKELVEIKCSICCSTFCIKHRNEASHQCTGPTQSLFGSIVKPFTSKKSEKCNLM